MYGNRNKTFNRQVLGLTPTAKIKTARSGSFLFQRLMQTPKRVRNSR